MAKKRGQPAQPGSPTERKPGESRAPARNTSGASQGGTKAQKTAPVHKAATKPKAKPQPKQESGGGEGILAWEDDPGSGAGPVTRPVPDLTAGPLALNIVAPAPPPRPYPVGSREFRYWAAAEAARRGADFWGAILTRCLGSAPNWQPGGALKLRLDQGVDLNAYYDRAGLSFFHDTVGGQVYYSGESPDIVCHELGHAVLDAFRPELWGANLDEAAAFHESFGDMSALLSALQLDSFVQSVLAETGGRLYRSTRLSRLAEQLGAAIRAVSPDAAEPDCLRNAVNSLFYRPPTTIPAIGPASSLSSEAHSFSRVFTGAFFEALAGMLAVAAPSNPQVDHVREVGEDLALLLVQGVLAASIVPDYFSQVAAAMINAGESDEFGGKYRETLKGAFVRHGILSLDSAAAAHGATMGGPSLAFGSPSVARSTTPSAAPPRTRGGRTTSAAAASLAPDAHLLQIQGQKLGLGARNLLVHAPEVPHHFLATSAGIGLTAASAPSHRDAVEDYVTDLFRRGRVEFDALGDPDTRLTHPLARKTHRLEPAGDQLALVRVRFFCGFGHDGCGGCV